MSKWISAVVGAAALSLTCIAAAQTAADHTQHHPAPASAAAPAATPPTEQAPTAMPQMQQHMREHMVTMQTLHKRFAAAQTPAEREALMADHMKAMQEGMDRRKHRSGMGGLGSRGGKARAGAAPMDPAQHQPSMELCMGMMQNMMDMMAQRMPATPPAK